MKTTKIIAIFLIICILFNVLPVYAIAVFFNRSISLEAGANIDNALHFIITHWHDVPSTDVTTENENSSDYSLIVEGYIVPSENNEYDFYFIKQETGEAVKLADNIAEVTPYIESINREFGVITLSIKPVCDENGTNLERFSGISVSAGHNTITSNNNSSIQISYCSNVHLVKAHVFYSNEAAIVFGSGTDDAVFGSSEIQSNLEQDTMWVYTYIRDVNNCQKGDIVRDESGHPIFDKVNIPNNLVEGVDVAKTKIYSTLAGLHTDKTATAIDDRTFKLDLESWFSGAPVADIGLVLDASGSMSFTSDELEPININNLNLTAEQKAVLASKILNTEKYKESPSTEEWENNIFLTNEEVNYLLNTNNTDDSKLSASNYSYYVFDSRNAVNEYVALGYWDGSIRNIKEKIIGYYEFNRGTSQDPAERDWLLNTATGKSAKLVNQVKSGENISFQEAALPQDWGQDPCIKLNNSKGLCLRNIENGVGILLDAVPTSQNFTISFKIVKDKSEGREDNTDSQNYTDLLYIGKTEQVEGTNYFRAIRDGRNGGSVEKTGNPSARLKGYNNELTSANMVANINKVFSSYDEQHTITFVFNNGKLSTYMDGNLEETNTDVEVSLSDYNIVINGFNNNYNGADIYIDNVVVLDTALNLEQVQNIESIVGDSSSTPEYIVYNNRGNSENIGVVLDDFVGFNKGIPGWYYINYGNYWENRYFNEDIQSAKVFWGISGNNDLVFTDTVTSDDYSKLKNTEYVYNPKKNTPTQFYIDEDGYLRCFFASGMKPDLTGTSLVYFKDDAKYIKTEALQRAIGSFARHLNDVSPDSQISAVRFSTEKIPDTDLDKLVLLDWTNDHLETQSMMSLNRGIGGTMQGTLSNPKSPKNKPIYQYNYGITGDTATYTGLKSFYENLYTRANEESAKYLIIFTDGKDSTDDDKKQQSISIAKDLRDAGYTIFAIMLTGGSVEKNDDATSEYQQAKKFLLELIGTSDANENKEDYFFSTLEGEQSIDSLTEIFSNNILKRITYNLASYTVQDYIDPRFDLVSSDENIYNLNADGNVVIKNKDGVVIESYNIKNSSLSIKLSNSYIVDDEARIADLHYSNGMYYLKWNNQIIPGCSINAERLPVWNAQVTIRAKDDFIGGNAILTNGNLEKMNLVFFEQDSDYSSGVDDVYIEEGDEYPSKGFPRVVVNIGSSENNFTEVKQIYMGETINNNEYSENLLKNTYNKLENTDLYYYLEYLERYALSKGEKLSDYEEKIITGNKVKIPYYYLPNAEGANQTGSTKHESDLIGYMEYELVPISKDENIVVQDANNKEIILTIKYTPISIDSESGEENSRKAENLKLVSETKYLWNQSFKPDVGNKAVNKNIITNNIVEVVSGEIALKVVFNPEVQKAIGNEQVTYQIDLMRKYEGVSKKVGTFKAVYEKNSLPEPDENGNITILAKITYDDENSYMSNYGLPIGTYTLENVNVVTNAKIKLDAPVVIKDGNLYTKELFTIGKDLNSFADYLALFENNDSITLGALNNEKDYTNYRYGLLEVVASVVPKTKPTPQTPAPEPEEQLPSRLPDTDGGMNYVTVLWSLTIISIAVTIITKIYIIKKDR